MVAMGDKGPGSDGGAPKNPMFKCRIFVGNLPTDFLSKPEVVERFAKYGPVIEVSLHRGFAFVQFKNTEDALSAIKGEKGSNFKGSEIDCSFAKHERGSGNKGNKGGPGGGRFDDRDNRFDDRDKGGPGGRFDDRDKGGPGGRFDDRDKGGPGGRFDDRDKGGPGGRFDDRDKDRLRDLDRDRDRFPPYDRERPPFDRDGPPPPRGRDRSPLRDRYEDRFRDPYHRDDVLRRDRYLDDRRSPLRRDPRDLDPYDRDRLPPPRDDPYRRDDPRDRDDPYLRDRERDIISRERDDPYRRDRDPFDRDRDPYDRDRGAPRDRDMRDPLDRRGPPPSGPDPSLDGPIDCEIIVVNKAQREYAENVQRRIRVLQVQVGIIYLNSEMQLSTALDDVSRRGVLYAIVITSQHEVHKSVTVNILHGTPQEHRNMPLEDAMSLIGRNFDRYMQNLRDKSGLPPPAGPVGQSRAAVPPVSPPPRQGGPPPAAGGPGSFSSPGAAGVELTIPQLLNLLADGKQLTIDELARVIEFLQELRQRMIRDQGGNPAAKPTDFGRSADSRGPTGVGGSSAGYPSNNGGRKEVDMDLDSDEDIGAGQPPGGPPKNPNAQIQAKILSMIRPGGEASPSPGPGPQTKMSAAITPPSANRDTMQRDAMQRDAMQRDNDQPPMMKKDPPPSIGPVQPQIGPVHPQMGPMHRARPPAPSNVQAISHQPPPPPASAPGGPAARGPRPPLPPAVTSGNINFDNPNVKKALDNLIQSGPNLLRNIAQVTVSLPTQPAQSPPASAGQAPPNMAAQQTIQAQQAQYAQYHAAAAQHNALMQAHMQAHAAYQQQQQQRQQAPPGMTPQGYMQQMMQQQQQQQPGGAPRYGGPY